MSTCRGLLRVQRWPKKVGPPRTPQEDARRKLFGIYQGLIKRLSPVECNYEREAIKQHNRTHRGQRGSAAIRFRDWQMQRLYGRGVAITVSPELTFWPWGVNQDASKILDWCTDVQGNLLQRSAETWEDIPHGTEGQLLTAGSPAQANQWTTL